MDDELGLIQVREVGLLRPSPMAISRETPGPRGISREVVRPMPGVISREARPAVTRITPTVARAAVRRRLEEEKRDPLDAFITKMEEFRPKCPVEAVENTWKKLSSFVVDITPPFLILSPVKPAELRRRR